MSIRYKLDSAQQWIWSDEAFQNPINLPDCDKTIFLNILNRTDTFFKVRAFLPNGDYIDGYLPTKFHKPIKIHNADEFFDGRFNS